MVYDVISSRDLRMVPVLSSRTIFVVTIYTKTSQKCRSVLAFFFFSGKYRFEASMRLVRLCLVFLASYCAVVLGAPGADVIITCPQAFRDNEKNTITCVVNSTSIAKLPCAVPPTQVNFVITKRTEESSSSMCYATYPCTTTSHPTTSRPCSCTDKTPAGIFSYTFLFAANETIHENAKLACTACAGPVTERQENCDSLNFESYDGDSRTAGDDADSNSPGNTNHKIGNTASNASDMKGSSSSNLALIIGAIVGGVAAVAMAIGTAAWC